jgi:hypothetical protein
LCGRLAGVASLSKPDSRAKENIEAAARYLQRHLSETGRDSISSKDLEKSMMSYKMAWTDECTPIVESICVSCQRQFNTEAKPIRQLSGGPRWE